MPLHLPVLTSCDANAEVGRVAVPGKQDLGSWACVKQVAPGTRLLAFVTDQANRSTEKWSVPCKRMGVRASRANTRRSVLYGSSHRPNLIAPSKKVALTISRRSVAGSCRNLLRPLILSSANARLPIRRAGRPKPPPYPLLPGPVSFMRLGLRPPLDLSSRTRLSTESPPRRPNAPAPRGS